MFQTLYTNDCKSLPICDAHDIPSIKLTQQMRNIVHIYNSTEYQMRNLIMYFLSRIPSTINFKMSKQKQVDVLPNVHINLCN